MMVGLFIGIWIARYLGPADFGLFSYAQSFVVIFTSISMMGLNSLVVKEIVNNPNKIDSILGTSFIMKLAASLIVLVLIFLSINFTDNDSDTKMLIYIISFGLFFQNFNVIEFYFQSKILSKYIAYTNVISLAISSIIKILFIINNATLIYFAWLTVFDIVILSSGYLYFYYIQKLSIYQWSWDTKISLQFLREGWPLILSGMSFVIYNNVDKIMIQNMLDNESVGLYSAASRLVLVWQFIPGLILASFMPALLNAHKKEKQVFYGRLQYIASLLIWGAILLALFYTYLSDFIISMTYGADYINSAEILTILIWSNVLIFFNALWNRWMLIEGNTKITFFFSLGAGFLNIIFNYYFIDYFGVIGASYAIILAFLISYCIYYIYLDVKVFKFFISSLFLFYLWGKK
jgi:O-antigen/teichoic acid export membrane protein